jgi:hypothetical protein
MIGWLLSLPGAVKRWAIIAAGAAFVLGVAILKGMSIQDAKHYRKQAKAAAKSTKDMNNVDTMRDSDDDARRERLRDFAKRNDRP